MKGFSRSEFILVNGEPHMLEMNTIPGLTTESLIHNKPKPRNFTGGFVY
jgi:D-alanine-D-alanine ligase